MVLLKVVINPFQLNLFDFYQVTLLGLLRILAFFSQG